MTSRHQNHDPEQQKILRELLDPGLQAILRMERPRAPNRAAARALGAKSVEDQERDLAERQQRLERFRAATCARWLADQYQELLPGWLFRVVDKRPRVLWWLGIGTFVREGHETLKGGRVYPTTTLQIKWLWFTLRIQNYAWEV